MDKPSNWSRREVLRKSTIAAGGLAFGGAAFGGNAAAESPQIKCGQTRVGTLTRDNPSDEYSFTLESPSTVNISLSVGTKRGKGDGKAKGQDEPGCDLTGNENDTVVSVWDENGNLVDYNDDIDFFNGNCNSRLETTLGAGTYTIRAGEFGFGPEQQDSYHYRLTVECS